METALYLLPVTLGDTPLEQVLPSYNTEIIRGIRHFIVEDVRSARRFLKKVDREIDIDALTFYPLNKHTSPDDISGYLQPLVGGASMGVISEAGCPAVADPGADVVAIAQRKKLKVVPLVGPSSIILSVMASGFNGQSFAFHGYLPIDASQRTNAIKKLEGVNDASVSFMMQKMTIDADDARFDEIMKEVVEVCKKVEPDCIINM